MFRKFLCLAPLLSLLSLIAACEDRTSTQSTGGELAFVYEVDGVQLTSREALYDFGAAYMESTVEHTLVLKNVGVLPLKISKLERVSGEDRVAVALGQDVIRPVFSIDLAPVELAAGDELSVPMRFLVPVSESDLVVDHQVVLSVTAEERESAGSPATVTIKGRAISGACEFPAELDFGKVPRESNARFSFVVRNVSNAAVDASAGIIDATSSGDYLAFDYTVDSARGDYTIAAKSTRTVTIAFTPQDVRPYAAFARMQAASECPPAIVRLKGEGDCRDPEDPLCQDPLAQALRPTPAADAYSLTRVTPGRRALPRLFDGTGWAIAGGDGGTKRETATVYLESLDGGFQQSVATNGSNENGGSEPLEVHPFFGGGDPRALAVAPTALNPSVAPRPITSWALDSRGLVEVTTVPGQAPALRTIPSIDTGFDRLAPLITSIPIVAALGQGRAVLSSPVVPYPATELSLPRADGGTQAVLGLSSRSLADNGPTLLAAGEEGFFIAQGLPTGDFRLADGGVSLEPQWLPMRVGNLTHAQCPAGGASFDFARIERLIADRQGVFALLPAQAPGDADQLLGLNTGSVGGSRAVCSQWDTYYGGFCPACLPGERLETVTGYGSTAVTWCAPPASGGQRHTRYTLQFSPCSLTPILADGQPELEATVGSSGPGVTYVGPEEDSVLCFHNQCSAERLLKNPSWVVDAPDGLRAGDRTVGWRLWPEGFRAARSGANPMSMQNSNPLCGSIDGIWDAVTGTAPFGLIALRPLATAIQQYSLDSLRFEASGDSAGESACGYQKSFGTVVRNDPETPRLVYAAFDKIYSEPLSDLGAPSAMPPTAPVRLTVLPGARITSMAVLQGQETRSEYPKGYALAAERVFFFKAATPARWERSEIDLAVENPLALFNDGERGRLGLSSGEVLSLPGMIGLAPALPLEQQPARQFMTLCGQAFVLGASELYRLDAPASGSFQGTWSRVDLGAVLPGKTFTAPGLHLARGRGRLLVFSDTGDVAAIRSSACPGDGL